MATRNNTGFAQWLACILITIVCTLCYATAFGKSEVKVKYPATAIYYNAAKDTTDDSYATYFVVVADTSLNYYTLYKKMLTISKQLSIPINTMGRFYNKTKKLIALPDNDADEIYAGAYLPRRSPSDDLSLEYMNFYKKQAGEKTIALVRGIYETKQKADRVLNRLQKIEKKAFAIQANVYVGCMH